MDDSASPPKLLDRVRTAVRVRHDSRRTEQASVDWIRRDILFHKKRHPSTMGAAEISAFWAWLAVQRRVSASTQKDIGGHLGHRSADATAVYAKVDVPSLREVARFDLGGVL